MKPVKTVLTDQELEIMKIVWQRGSVTVRDVYEDLLRQRRIAYTTVMTMMGILEQKGHLKRNSADRAYIYKPSRPRGQVVGTIVKDFLNRVFDGSAEPLLVHLVESSEIDEKQLKEITRLLKEKRRKK